MHTWQLYEAERAAALFSAKATKTAVKKFAPDFLYFHNSVTLLKEKEKKKNKKPQTKISPNKQKKPPQTKKNQQQTHTKNPTLEKEEMPLEND